MICRYEEGAIWLEAGSDPQAERLQVADLAVGTFSAVAKQSFQAERYVEPAFWKYESRRVSNHDLEQLLESYDEELFTRAALHFSWCSTPGNGGELMPSTVMFVAPISPRSCLDERHKTRVKQWVIDHAGWQIRLRS
jgi:hypothetical protein